MIPRHLQIGVVILLVAVVVMAFYVRRMRGRATETAARAVGGRPVAPPVAGASEPVTLYVAYDDAGVLRAQPASLPLPAGRQQRAQELLRALLEIYQDKHSPHLLGSGADIRDVYVVDPGLAVIDTNAAFADGHRSGVLVEELTVSSLVQTLAVNIPAINRVKILIEGKERETLAGHADLSHFFDTAALGGTVNQLATAAQ